MNDSAPVAASPAASHAASPAASPAASAGITPPQGLPVYRLLTGPDDAAFCRRVSEALALGYRLHGSPAATFNGTQVIVAQALLWPGVA
jgi:hypothetical protein